LDDEERENQRRRDELAALRCELRAKERCVAELTSDNDCLRSELDLTTCKLDKYHRELEDANQR